MAYAHPSNLWGTVAVGTATLSRASAQVHLPGSFPLPKGDRMLGMFVNESESNEYEYTFSLAVSAGVETVSVVIPWDLFETSPNVYTDYCGILESSRIFYPANNTPIGIVFPVIDTVTNRVPSDLSEKDWVDPELIARFENFMDYVSTNLVGTDIRSIGIGNEIDGYLGADAVAWSEFETFYERTSAYVRDTWTNVPIGTRIMYPAFFDSSRTGFVRSIGASSDVYMVTYYPLNGDFTVKDPAVVKDDFLRMASTYRDKPIYFVECGYPSSPACNSSEEKQAAFIAEVFKAWDVHAENIVLVEFEWLTDRGGEDLAAFTNYYGMGGTNFYEYLRTLGYRTWPGDGTEKLALDAFRFEAHSRGW